MDRSRSTLWKAENTSSLTDGVKLSLRRRILSGPSDRGGRDTISVKWCLLRSRDMSAEATLSSADRPPLARTPLFDLHVGAGARMVGFAGYLS